MAFSGDVSVYQHLLEVRERHGAGFLVLIDPDRTPIAVAVQHAEKCVDAGVDALLVGTSLMMKDGFGEYVAAIRDAVDVPVIIFPGENSHVSESADAILFLSLLSGRNPDYLIGEQVRSAPLIKKIGLEAIATAYLLIDSGRITSVEFMSNTKPVPADKPDIALAHAMAAELFGMKLVYLEAGSGAVSSVPDDMVRMVSSGVDIPVIVGGGLRTPEQVRKKVEAGASFVVIGNHLETGAKSDELREFVRAAHRE